MLDYEKLSYGLYDAVSQALRLIEQEQQHCEEACMQSRHTGLPGAVFSPFCGHRSGAPPAVQNRG